MLFNLLYFLTYVSAQINIHTFLILNQSKIIFLPNILQRTIINSEQQYFRNLYDQEYKQQLLNNNFSTQYNDVQISTRKYIPETKQIIKSNGAIIIYEIFQNLLSIQEIINQYDQFKTNLLTDTLIILIQSNISQKLQENIYLTDNYSLFIDNYDLPYDQQELKFDLIDKANQYLQQNSFCPNLETYRDNIQYFPIYEQFVDIMQNLQVTQLRILYWEQQSQFTYAEHLYSQNLNYFIGFVQNYQINCEIQVQQDPYNIQKYQFTILSILLVGFALIQQFVKNFSTNKDKFV